MALTATDANRSFLPEEAGELIIKPVIEEATSLQVATVTQTQDTHQYRVPIIAADPTAEWTAEGEEIDPSNASLSEDVSPFYKLAGLTIISRELAEDSSPAAAEMIGQGLARDIARKLDTTFFGKRGDTSPAIAPRGLEDLTPSAIAAEEEWKNIDPFIAAIYNAEGEGAQLTSFTAHPDDALALAQLKEGSGSNRNLLQPDPTSPTRRNLAGLPLYTSTGVTPGTIWGIPQPRVMTVLRDDVRIEVDHSIYFTSDRVAVKATLRATNMFPHASAIQKIMLNGS